MKDTAHLPLSSVKGKIRQLLVTLPPAPEIYVDEYYQQIVSTFETREKVIRYRNYAPPRGQGGSSRESRFQEMDLEEQLHAIIGDRRVLNFVGCEDFYHNYVGDLIH